MYRLESFVAISLSLAVSLVQAQIYPAVLQSVGFNSSFTLSPSQIESANLSDSLATSFSNAIRFERSQLANGGPYEDDFYVLPPLSNSSNSLKPGVLLKAQFFTNTSSFTLAPNTALSRILYTTTNFNGTVVPASAFVLWPFAPRRFNDSDGDAKPRTAPVVLWTHGTSGFFPSAAPSTNRALWYGDTVPFTLARAGYAVVAPDYAGLGVRASWDGSKIPHQYLASPAGAHDALYALRAARSAFPGLLGEDFVVMGHSQGGGVAWSVAEVLASDAGAGALAPDLGKGYLGAIAGSPTTDLFAGEPDFVGAWVGMTLGSVFPSFALGDWLTPAGAARAALLREVEGGPAAWMQLARGDGQRPVRDSYNETWYAGAYAELANAGGRAFRGPLLVLQGTADVYIPYEVTSATVRRTCALGGSGGGDLEYLVVNGTGHVPTLDATRQAWLRWIRDRFEKKPVARSGCVTTTLQSFLPLEQYQARGNSVLQWAGASEYNYETLLGA